MTLNSALLNSHREDIPGAIMVARSALINAEPANAMHKAIDCQLAKAKGETKP